MKSTRLNSSTGRLLSLALLATLALVGCTTGAANTNEPIANTNDSANSDINSAMPAKDGLENSNQVNNNINDNEVTEPADSNKPDDTLTQPENTNKDDGTSMNTNKGAVKTITVSAKSFAYTPNQIKVKKGDTVKIVLSNTDGFHDWVLDEFNAKTSRINAGQTAEVQFVANKAGSFEFYCSVGRHRSMGMVGTLIVE